jgi:hypothetical protein
LNVNGKGNTAKGKAAKKGCGNRVNHLVSTGLEEKSGLIVVTANEVAIGEGYDIVVKGFVEADSSHVRISEGGEKKREPFSLHVVMYHDRTICPGQNMSFLVLD